MSNTAEEFFNSLKKADEIDTTSPWMQDEVPAAATETETPKEEDSEHRPTRRERRDQRIREEYEARLQEEREARIRLEEQVKNLATVKEAEAVDPDLRNLLEGKVTTEEAARIFSKKLESERKQAVSEAMELMREEYSSQEDDVDALVNEINENIDFLEEKYNVDLTDNVDERNKFLDFVKSLTNGDTLPNMEAAYKYYAATKKAAPTNVEQKRAIATRGMVHSQNQNAPEPSGQLAPMGDRSFSRIWDKVVNRTQ